MRQLGPAQVRNHVEEVTWSNSGPNRLPVTLVFSVSWLALDSLLDHGMEEVVSSNLTRSTIPGLYANNGGRTPIPYQLAT